MTRGVERRWWTKPLAFLFWLLVSLHYVTLRRSGRCEDENFTWRDQSIMALWHNRVYSAIPYYHYFVRGKRPMLNIIASASKDGAFIGSIAAYFKMTTSYGSSHRRGTAAFRDMQDALDAGKSVCFAPDGSRGPMYKCHLGVVKLASLTGVPIAPVCIDMPTCWRFRKSWDKFIIPKPFSRITVLWRKPFYVPPHLDNEQLQEYAQQLTELMSVGRPDFDEV